MQYGFLTSRRWIGFGIFAFGLAALCIWLGMWQYDRYEDRRDRNIQSAARISAEPIPVDEIAGPGINWDPGDEWTRVVATGSYDTDSEVTVKFMHRDGSPGVDVVTPLILDSGGAILVNRGWMPTENNVQAPQDVPVPPAGQVTVEGWLRVNNNAGGQAVRPVDGQVRAIDSRAMDEFVTYDLRTGYLNLQVQEPSSDVELTIEEPPEFRSWVNFFYSLQWYFFAGLAVLGYFWFARSEAKENQKAEQVGPPDSDQAKLTRSR